MFFRVKTLAAAIAVSAAATAPTAHAQSAAGAEMEVVRVIEKRRAYRGDFESMETPQSIQVLSAIVMDRAGVRDLNQALDLAASVARQNNFGGLWNSFAIRGFLGDENLPSNYLVNGFNAGRGFGGARDISGIESVEVLKGPVAALFGRGEPGGAVNLVTKRPTGEAAGQVRLSGDDFGTYRGDIDYNSAWLADTAAVRLVGYYEDGDTFRDEVDITRYGMTPSILLRLGENTSLLYELEATRQEVPFDRGVAAIGGALGAISERRFLGEPGDGDMTAKVLGHQLELRHALTSEWDVLVGANLRDTSLDGFSTEAELTGSRQLLNRDGRTLTRQRRFREYDAQYWVLRAELAGQFSTGGIEHRVLLGVDTDRFENDQQFLRYRAPTLGSNPTRQQLLAIDVFAPQYGAFPPPAVSPLTNRVEVLEASGAYLQDQLTLNDRWQLRLGMRYDDFSQSLLNRASGSRLSQSDGRWSPQAGVVYTLSPQWAAYAGYGEGFRALTGADFGGNPFNPTTSESMEVGVKFELLDGQLSGTVALFQQEQDNMLAADPVNSGFSQALGEARSRGLEVDLQGRLGVLDLLVSYAYVDAETRNAQLDPNFELPIPIGSPLLNVPKHTLSVQLSGTLDRPGIPLTTLGGGLLHVDERLGEIATSFTLPSYTLVRAFADVQIAPRVRLRGELDNLFNQDHYTNSFSQLWVEPGMPRRARISVVMDF